MSECPYCHDTEHQVKAGKHESGSQQYKCRLCQRRYTPEPSQRYGDELRRQAVKWYADGLGFRQIGRHLGVDHATVMRWVKAHTDQLPPAPLPEETPLHIVEMDELYTFIGKKKSRSGS
jgi:transposase-like protein